METSKEFDLAINGLRERIDAVDKQLLSLVADRARLIEEVGHLKRRHNIPMMQSSRVEDVYRSRTSFGVSLGLDEQLIRHLYDALLGYSFAKEQQIIDAGS